MICQRCAPRTLAPGFASISEHSPEKQIRAPENRGCACFTLSRDVHAGALGARTMEAILTVVCVGRKGGGWVCESDSAAGYHSGFFPPGTLLLWLGLDCREIGRAASGPGQPPKSCCCHGGAYARTLIPYLADGDSRVKTFVNIKPQQISQLYDLDEFVHIIGR